LEKPLDVLELFDVQQILRSIRRALHQDQMIGSAAAKPRLTAVSSVM
jgi:hypothetical protein